MADDPRDGNLLSPSRILEASFGLSSAAIGIVVLPLARSIVPTLTLFMHRRAIRILVIIQP